MCYHHVYEPTLKSTCIKLAYFNLALFFYHSSFNVEIKFVSHVATIICLSKKYIYINMTMLKCVSLRHVCISAYSKRAIKIKS